jgi:hypothetical protein
MKKMLAAAIFLLACLAAAPGQEIRRAVWAGQFYDADAARLGSQIDGFLKNAAGTALADPILALIVPHAGYIYSGRVAAEAYRLIQGKAIDSVVIIGPSHRYGFRGCSIYMKGGFETPLGVAGIDEALASEIAKASGFNYIAEAHREEHSIEVQVPFVRKVLPGAKIVPIVMGSQNAATVRSLADALAKVLPGKKAVVIASTDMSHFLPKEEAGRVDADTASLIRSQKTKEILDKIEAGENIMCGGGPVVATILYAQKRGKTEVTALSYADSSSFGGPVVGYLSAVLTSKERPAEDVSPRFTLSDDEKGELLRLARTAVTQFVEQGTVCSYNTQNPNFQAPKGAFVTLKKGGELRGCIGYIEPVAPLYQTVLQTAVYAASKDPRFEPVSKAELQALEYEISVLTPLEPVADPKSVEVGKHGLVISMGERKGLLLPQVPVENGWNRDQFLSQTCLKAGLPSDAWKKGAKIFSFEAIVFH